MKDFLRSFVFAWIGILNVLKERNFRIHLLILSAVISMGFYFQITATEWIVILVISAVVLALEMVNSSIERLCDLYTTDRHKEIAKIKDIAAGAVLVAAFFAAVTGSIIFYKYLFIS